MIKSKILKTIVAVAIVLMVLYLAASIIISVLWKNTLKDIYRSKSYGEMHSSIVMDERMYNILDVKTAFQDEDTKIFKDNFKSNFPITLIGPNKFTVIYKTTYEAFDENNELIGGGDEYPILTLRFIDGKLTVTDFAERMR